MPETNTPYEGLFLMSPSAGGDLAGSVEFIREMLDRAGAEILTIQKWDDRKLAYPVRGQKRGMYIIALFRVGGVQIANIERDCNLSEQVVRVLITRGEHLGDLEVEAMVKAGEKTAAEIKLRETPQEEAATDASAEESSQTTEESSQTTEEASQTTEASSQTTEETPANA